MGRASKPPPQLGQTFNKTLSTHARQKVHSNEQIMASVALGGRDRLQCSHEGRSSSAMGRLGYAVIGDDLPRRREFRLMLFFTRRLNQGGLIPCLDGRQGQQTLQIG
jgi:hypothetical protein